MYECMIIIEKGTINLSFGINLCQKINDWKTDEIYIIYSDLVWRINLKLIWG